MKRFISVPTKLLILIVSILLILAVGFSALSLSRLQDDYKQYHQNTLAQGQAQFALHSDILRSKMNVWLESFSEITKFSQQQDLTVFAEQLANQFDGLQLNLNIENVWLVDANKKSLFETSTIPEFAQNNIDHVLKLQSPNHQVLCQQECYLLLSVPLLNNHGDTLVITMTASLVDMLYAINTSLNSDVAVVSVSLKSRERNNNIEVISSSNMDLTISLLNANQETNLDFVLEYGLQIDLFDRSYLVNLLPLANNSEKEFYLSLIDDVTDFEEQSAKYRQQLLMSLSAIFFVLALVLYGMARLFSKRLLSLSGALPLLANKRFDQFREVKFKRPILFSDELDLLSDSALELSYELEQLNLEVEQKTKELENIAMYDLLTGLPNRNMLNYQLRKSIANIGRYPGGVAVLFLDLDDFKKVNDSNGHTEGDKLLIQAAERVRLSVGKMDLACRFGGDEFVVVLGGLSSVNEAINIAEQLLAEFKQPIKLGSSIFYVSTSIGISYTESSKEKAENLIAHADIAMYEAKDNGGSQFHIYHQEMFQRVAHRVMLEGEVRQALAKQQFSLSLQPQLRATDNKIYGFEALLRWKHPERGMVSPEDFIPILENSQHMIELGYWIIHRCFELAVMIREQGLTDVRIAINLSAGQFIDKDLPGFLKNLLDEFSLSADIFELELTEQTLVKDIDHTIVMMDRLKVMGFSFAIDDFGTGYSSLAYIKKMPIDVIKIDKSFVFGMLENHADYQIIMSTIAMVKNLGLTVIAEGVETAAQLRSLTENNCDLIQGYYFSKPVPEIDLIAFIQEYTHNGYWKTQVGKD
ncbi:bifunctional diguanylate cyclase/phosphodiesterase [Colwellia sp. 20A7]|uniref:bifunctional diguanylate cyclase/phosphodiesterase n=1 Tax=Colwellia sp. 20A7 TaxID=2689569 RepID=UPI00135BD41C|nr:EAL domain-containing protein [Colwellia sp. 20A7]